MAEELAFENQQIEAMDRMLLNAYGTAYKIAAKYLIYKDICHQWSVSEELLLAKNLVTNLWSVLDYCCILIYTKSVRRPDPATARQIGTPCHFTRRQHAITQDIDDAFQDLQYTNYSSNQRDVLTFYRLHFLRNTLSHETINISDNMGGGMPAILQTLGLDQAPEVAVDIQVPHQPWNTDAGNTPVPLLNLLLNACRLVEQRRDRILVHQLKLAQPFGNKFRFTFIKNELRVTFQHTTTVIRHKDLHLKCYGLEKEYEEDIAKVYPA